jgi:hypothetical protein
MTKNLMKSLNRQEILNLLPAITNAMTSYGITRMVRVSWASYNRQAFTRLR